MPVIVVHGGAGKWRREGEEHVHAALRDALHAGGEVLARGGKALDAVQAAVESLEDSPQFNAGRGAVVTADGTVELDAAIMDGAGRRAGACAAVTGVRHPIALARTVLEGTPHVLMAGRGAERLADEAGLERVGHEWFERAAETSGPEAIPPGEAAELRARSAEEVPIEEAETVGAVAIDQAGHLAAATSTGGMKGQLPGRVGDAPLPGAGTWAEDGICAVSATGDGEAFITAATTHEVAALTRHAGLGLAEACSLVLHSRVPGTGGLIAVDGGGRVALPFTTPAMARGVLWIGGEPWTAIAPADPPGEGPLRSMRTPETPSA
jgi:beta-aspartyl-peptidase (threonine type)